DLLANPKCSLLVARDPEDRTGLRITLHGDAVLVVSDKDQAAVRSAYLAKHPNAFWVDFGDFSFVRIEPKVVRFVSGVATAFLGSGGFFPTSSSLCNPVYMILLIFICFCSEISLCRIQQRGVPNSQSSSYSSVCKACNGICQLHYLLNRYQ
ncbi:hypothetical protein DY000_02051542, partial [Brassica cretica]